jgi:peptide/nickel transport system substrate-binding protein
VVFTFAVYLDEKVHAPQRDLLVVGGKPIEVRKKDDTTVIVTLAEPYAVTDRLFGGIPMLPKHALAGPYAAGTLGRAWGVDAPPASIVGLGLFRLKEHVPGERVVLERNPLLEARSAGDPLPFLDRLIFEVASNAEAEFLRFKSGTIDVMSRLTAEQFAALGGADARYHAVDAGPEWNTTSSLQLNDLPAGASSATARKQAWFRQDRSGTRSRPLSIARRSSRSSTRPRRAVVGSVTRANRAWFNDRLPRPARSLDSARALPEGRRVHVARRRHAGRCRRHACGVLADDLAKRDAPADGDRDPERPRGSGSVNVAVVDLGAVRTASLKTFDYEACILGTASSDTDPNADINIWLSSAPQHFGVRPPRARRPRGKWRSTR